MTATTWPQVTCTECGMTGPGRPGSGLCKRCYARALHPIQPCAGCGQIRRHLAAGLCARCYRLSRTRLVTCPGCGELRPVYFGDRCERCKRQAAARAGACADCGKQAARLWSGRCCTCRARFYATTGACADCGDLTMLTSGLCKACRLFRWGHPTGTCPHCGRQQPIGAAGGCRSCQAASRAAARARRQRTANARARPELSPPDSQLLDALRHHGDARGWSAETMRRARRALTAVLASRQDLGQPPWDAAAYPAVPERAAPGRAAGGRVPHRPGPAGGTGNLPWTGGWPASSRPCPHRSPPRCRSGPRACRAAGPARTAPAGHHDPGLPAHPAGPAGQLGRPLSVAAAGHHRRRDRPARPARRRDPAAGAVSDAVAVHHAQGPAGAVHQPRRAADRPRPPAAAGAPARRRPCGPACSAP